MIKTTLYIGSNNVTGVVEVEKLLVTLEKNNLDFTFINDVIGIWKGKRENSCIITIINDSEIYATTGLQYKDLLAILKIELAQDSILMTQETIKAIFA